MGSPRQAGGDGFRLLTEGQGFTADAGGDNATAIIKAQLSLAQGLCYGGLGTQFGIVTGEGNAGSQYAIIIQNDYLCGQAANIYSKRFHGCYQLAVFKELKKLLQLLPRLLLGRKGGVDYITVDG